MRRVDEALKHVLSDAIPKLKDPRIGFVTVTGVDTTTDLAQATVWVSVLGRDRERETTLRALEHAAGALQRTLGAELQLRRTPRLAFAYDPAVERGVRMTQLIDELAPAAEPRADETHADETDADEDASGDDHSD